MKFLCVTCETTGLVKPAILEFGWIFFDVKEPELGVGSVHLLDPGEAEFEAAAQQIHMGSGLIEAFGSGEVDTMDQVLEGMSSALDTHPHLMLWSKGFMFDLIPDAIVKKSQGSLDFGTVNQLRRVFANNDLLRPARSRSLEKLAVMRQALVDWDALFSLAGPR